MTASPSLSKSMNKLSGRFPNSVPVIRKVPLKKEADDVTIWCSKFFDFSKLGIKKVNGITNDKRKFWQPILFSHTYSLLLTNDCF